MTNPFGHPVGPGIISSRESANAVHGYTRAVRAAAASWEGRGEEQGRNNYGTDIDEMLRISGVGRRDKWGRSMGGPWCGVGCSTMLTLGTGTEDPRFAPCKLHAGAKALVKLLGDAGTFIVPPQLWTLLGAYTGTLDPEAMRWALLIAWHRGGGEPREKGQGHIEIVDHYDKATDTIRTWAPNVDPNPAARADLLERRGLTIVKGQAVWHRREHGPAKWRHRLYAIASLA